MVKVVYIVSDVNKAVSFEWIAAGLDKSLFDLSFILLNPGASALEEFLVGAAIPVNTVVCRSKKDWPMALLKVYRLLRKNKPDIIHCHLINANILGLTAGLLTRVKKRIYTRHHSSFHHVYFPKGVVWDKLANRLSTHIVAVSQLVKKILMDWEGVPESKISLIPHGFKLDVFSAVSAQRVAACKEKYQIVGRSPVVGVVSRFTELKGIQYIIPAFHRLLDQYPDAVLLLFNAYGDYEDVIFDLLGKLPQRAYRTIKFENDIAAAYKTMDIFVHTPIDDHSEAFGQTYIEALAAGVPSVLTMSGVAPDFIEDHKNALVVPYKNEDAVYEALLVLCRNIELAESLKSAGQLSIKDKYDINKMISRLEHLYLQK